jgi:hypothetical protein
MQKFVNKINNKYDELLGIIKNLLFYRSNRIHIDWYTIETSLYTYWIYNVSLVVYIYKK